MTEFEFSGITFKETYFGKKLSLVTDTPESECIEYKQFGRLFGVNSEPYRLEEIKKTILAFLNTNGGKIFLGVSDNGYLVGVDYTLIDKDNLLNHLKNLIINFGLEYDNMIQCVFHKIDPKYVIPCTKPGAERYLVAIDIKKSTEPIIYPRDCNIIYTRLLASTLDGNYNEWKARNKRKAKKISYQINLDELCSKLANITINKSNIDAIMGVLQKKSLI